MLPYPSRYPSNRTGEKEVFQFSSLVGIIMCAPKGTRIVLSIYLEVCSKIRFIQRCIGQGGLDKQAGSGQLKLPEFPIRFSPSGDALWHYFQNAFVGPDPVKGAAIGFRRIRPCIGYGPGNDFQSIIIGGTAQCQIT